LFDDLKKDICKDANFGGIMPAGEIEEWEDESGYIHLRISHLNGSDKFIIECIGPNDNPNKVLMQLAARLRLVSDHAINICGELLDRCWIPDKIKREKTDE